LAAAGTLLLDTATVLANQADGSNSPSYVSTEANAQRIASNGQSGGEQKRLPHDHLRDGLSGHFP